MIQRYCAYWKVFTDSVHSRAADIVFSNQLVRTNTGTLSCFCKWLKSDHGIKAPPLQVYFDVRLLTIVDKTTILLVVNRFGKRGIHMAKDKMTICKHCGAEIAAGAKTCPKCGGKNKKPIYKRVWFWILVAVLVLGIGGAAGGSGGSDSSSSTATTNDTQAEESAPEEEVIEYAEVTTDELSDALEANAMNASDTYKDKYFAVTGRLSNIDSDGNYIGLVDINDELSFNVIQCYIKNDEQLEKVKKMSTDDVVTVRGKITDVGEVLGYSMDIDSID